MIFYGLPRWLSGKESACQCRRCRRWGFHPWVRKIPLRRKWQSTPVFLPGKFHGQRSLKGYSPQVHKESDTTERARAHTLFCMHLFYMLIFCSSVLYVYRMPQKLLCFLSFLNDSVLSLNISLIGGFIIHSHYLLKLIKKTLWLYNAGWEVWLTSVSKRKGLQACFSHFFSEVLLAAEKNGECPRWQRCSQKHLYQIHLTSPV